MIGDVVSRWLCAGHGVLVEGDRVRPVTRTDRDLLELGERWRREGWDTFERILARGRDELWRYVSIADYLRAVASGEEL